MQTTTRSKRSTSRRILKCFLLLSAGWSILAWLAARALIVSAPLASADAIVVLSGSSAYLERTHKAAELYREGRAPVVLLTDDHTRGGWSSAQQRNPFFVERALEELMKAGVPAEKIKIVPGIASGTRVEASLLSDYSARQGLRSLLVVTSEYHSRRALRSLQQSFAGTEIAIGLDPAVAPMTPSPIFWWLQLEGWRTVGGEYVKLVYYWFSYG
jgi:uncharacterized SAM-binding protein YcdF (DUF218 family)